MIVSKFVRRFLNTYFNVFGTGVLGIISCSLGQESSNRIMNIGKYKRSKLIDVWILENHHDVIVIHMYEIDDNNIYEASYICTCISFKFQVKRGVGTFHPLLNFEFNIIIMMIFYSYLLNYHICIIVSVPSELSPPTHGEKK